MPSHGGKRCVFPRVPLAYAFGLVLRSPIIRRKLPTGDPTTTMVRSSPLLFCIALSYVVN